MGDKAIEQWTGGRLRVIARERRLRLRKGKRRPKSPEWLSKDEQKALYEPYLKTIELGELNAVPLGNGLALLVDDDGRLSDLHIASGLWFDIEVRDGRPECVGIRADPDGPPVSGTRLRLALDDLVRDLVSENTIRLELDEDACLIGVDAASVLSTSDTSTTSADRVADVRKYLAGEKKPGRPALTDEFLRDVVAVYENARAQRQPTGAAIAERFYVEQTTARQWVHKAKTRGLFPTRHRQGEERHG